MEVGLGRASAQRTQLIARAAELEGELSGGDAPILEREGVLDGLLSRRLEIEAELSQLPQGRTPTHPPPP